MIMPLFHIPRSAALIGALCLWLGSQPAGAIPIPVSGPGVTTEGLIRKDIRVDYNPVTGKMTFSAVSAAGYADISSCTAGFNKGTSSTLLPVEDWKFVRHTPPTDWHIVIDESNSMRIAKNKRVYLREAIGVASQLLKNKGKDDTVTVHLVSSEMAVLGSSGDTAKLNAQLGELRKKAGEYKGRTQNLTAIFHHSINLVNSLESADSTNGRKRVLLLLTDGEDDASAQGEVEDLIHIAKQENKKVAICCVTFFNAKATRNAQVNTFERICTQTQGVFVFQNRPCGDGTAATLADNMYRTVNRPGCTFTISRPEHSDGASLQIKFRLADNKEAKLTLSAEAVKTVCHKSAAGTAEETDALVTDILRRVVAAGKSVRALTEAEHKSPADQQAVENAVSEFCKHTGELLSVCRELKSKETEKARQSVDKAEKKQGISAAESNALRYLRKLLDNTALKAEQLTDTHMAELLGRTTPLPYPGVGAIQQLLSRISAGTTSLKVLTQAETATTPDLPTISREAFSLSRKAEDMLEPARQLKKIQPDEQQQAINMFMLRSEVPAHEQAALQKIRTFCENQSLTAEQLTPAHMLELLGRSTPLPTPEADVLKTLRGIIARCAPAIKELAEAENAPDATERLQQALDAMQACIDVVRAPATTIKTLYTEAVLHTVRTAQAAEGVTEADKEVLARILSYCEDHTISADHVTEAQLLQLLGRDTALPEPVQVPPTPAWLYPAIGTGAGLLLLLIIILYIAYLKRRKDIEEKEQPPLPPEPHKPAALVPAGTPGISRDKVLAVLDEPGTTNQWWILEPLVTIGRDSCNDLVLTPADRTVSARHCAIKRERNGCWTMYDLGTPNKIYYNNQVLTQLNLTQGITVELGSVKIRFQATDNNG